MKVLHYISDFSLPSETFIYDMINNLDNNQTDNYILTHRRHLEDIRPFEKTKVIIENTNFINRVINKIYSQWFIVNEKEVLDFILELKPDVIHAHFGPNGAKIYNFVKKHKIDIKLVISFHGTDITMYPIKFKNYKKIVKEINNRGIICTFPSQFLRREFQERIGVSDCNNQIVVPNSFNRSFEEPLIDRNFLINNKKLINLVSVGRLISCKGFESLIKAFIILEFEVSNIHLTIVGDGPQQDTLLNLINEHGLQRKITLTGMLTHNEVKSILHNSDIYIQPSIVDRKTNQTESFGIATLEAIVVGLPVIVTDVGGLPETVLGGDPKFAKIVKPNSPEIMASTIKEMLNLKCDNSAYREKVMFRYSRDQQVTNFLNIYN
ncbi:glycosyltransferase family 4 protein [Vibrio sp. RC27]